ncbi:MAG: peptide chain release factor N(5)-glutamine methyltransferase [Verrucomicrobiota bacterium]
MTVLDVIQRSSEFLARRGVDSPRLQAELLLAHVLGLPRMRLYLDFERVLAPPQVDAMRELVRRRGEREPLQHLTGSTSFCGWEIHVTRDVLIPRPETEQLAEQAVRFLRGHRGEAPAVIDWGTGSGCLAIAIAAQCPGAVVDAVDASEAALAVARANAARHGLEARIRFHHGDGFAALPPGRAGGHDLIVSNPPYIPTRELDGLQPEVRDHDPRLALDGGADGLVCYRRLAAEAPAWLRPGARLMVEFGDGQERELRAILQAPAWTVETVLPDDCGRPRILIARRGD